MDGMCVMALAFATKTMSGAIFHPLVMILLMSGRYFVAIFSRVSTTNISLQVIIVL